MKRITKVLNTSLGVALLLFALVGQAGAQTWSPTDSTMGTARYWHTATLLADGRVLVSGGYSDSALLTSAEIYNPVAGTWSPTGAMGTGRLWHTATLLADGRVLVSGGSGGSRLASAEIYDPVAGTWSPTGAMGTARYFHTATLLADGRMYGK